MTNGPKFNNIKRDFATDNSMGYDEVVNTLQRRASPVITNITENVYYFGFIVWSFHDYEKNVDYHDRTTSSLEEHFKQQNFFFTASFLLHNINSTGAAGSRFLRPYLMNNEAEPNLEYNPKYMDTLQTTLGYYQPGLTPLFLMETEKADGEKLKCPQITPYGVELADVFESIIKDTEFFKKYRHSKIIPKSVLKELGNIVNLKMRNMPTLQKKLIEVLFYNKYNKKYLMPLTLNKDYLLYCLKKYDFNIDTEIYKVLYDYHSPRSLNYDLPKEFEKTAKTWEIIVGRQYFTLGLSMIWKHILYLLDEPLIEEKWIEKVKNKVLEVLNPNETIEELLFEAYYTYEERIKMLKVGEKQIHSNLIIDGLKIILSIYNRFNNREDLDSSFLEMFGTNDLYETIPLHSFFESVEFYKKDKVTDYIELIMRRLIKQNKIIGYKKLQVGKNGYYYEYNNGYYYKQYDYDYDYAGNRMINVYRAIQDLDLLGGVDYE